MMIDYNVSDHWSSDDPDWLKSLVSSFDRRHGVSAVLPLTVIVSKIAEWVQLASGVDAWRPGPNRDSLRLDVEESIGVIGPSLRTQIATNGRRDGGRMFAGMSRKIGQVQTGIDA